MENPVFLPPSCVCVIQGGGCQIKGSEVCNMTIQAALDQFPSLQGCVCAWEEELCDSMRALATQCHRKPGALFSVVTEISIYRWNCIFVYQRRSDVLCERTLLCYRMSVMNNRPVLRGICWRIMFLFIFTAAQQKRNTVTDWQSSSLIGYGNSFTVVAEFIS